MADLLLGQWLVDHSDLVILAWNGLPPKGRGGTGDVAAYARFTHRPFVHLDTRKHTVTRYGELHPHTSPPPSVSPKQEFTVAKHVIYQGPTLTVTQHRLQMPNGKEIIRDIVERPESVIVLPIAYQDIVLMIEEYDLGAGVWQLKLPGGKVEKAVHDGLQLQAQKELRQEIGYTAARWEKLLDIYSHPGYIAHKVHLFVAQELEWDPLPIEAQEEIRLRTVTLQEALTATRQDYRCDPEAALALWLYAGRIMNR